MRSILPVRNEVIATKTGFRFDLVGCEMYVTSYNDKVIYELPLVLGDDILNKHTGEYMTKKLQFAV